MTPEQRIEHDRRIAEKRENVKFAHALANADAQSRASEDEALMFKAVRLENGYFFATHRRTGVKQVRVAVNWPVFANDARIFEDLRLICLRAKMEYPAGAKVVTIRCGVVN